MARKNQRFKTMAIRSLIENATHKHRVGDSRCNVGSCALSGWPKPCECGGLIHYEDAGAIYASYESNASPIRKCDNCSEPRETSNVTVFPGVEISLSEKSSTEDFQAESISAGQRREMGKLEAAGKLAVLHPKKRPARRVTRRSSSHC